MPLERGAYGLRLVGLDAEELLLSAADPAWPALTVEQRLGSRPHFDASLRDGTAATPLLGGGALVVRQEPLTATYTYPRELTANELVHPFLAPAAALASHWLGREAFHAGAVAVDGSAWAIVGERNHGKSSLLAYLAAEGHAVLADDLVVLGGGAVFAGPRSIDLREETAAELGVGTHLGIVGERERWRLELGEAPPPLPLGGWVFLDWGDAVEVEPRPPAARLAPLLRQRAVQLPPTDEPALLSLLDRPAWTLRRPRRWEAMPAAVAALLGAIRALRRPSPAMPA